MSSISTEAKVGLFVLVALIILGYMSFRVGEQGFGLKKGYPVTVVFDNATGLEKDASVQIAGVEVGRVEDISLRNGKAQITLRIFPGVKLEKDAQAKIKAYGILGDKYIDIIPGTPGGEYIQAGEDIVKTEKQADIDRLLSELGTIAGDVMTVTASLKKTVGSAEGEENLRAIIENTRTITEDLSRIVKQNDAKLNLMVDNLSEASMEMRRAFASLNNIVEKIDRGEGTIGQLVENKEAFDNLNKTLASLRDITDKINRGEGSIGKLINEGGAVDNLEQTLASLRDITDKINRGEGSIGKLVNDEETVDNLNAGLKSIDKSMEGISTFISRADQFKTFLGYRGEYLFDSDDGKGYFDLTIRPNEDKFYILGLVADPRGKRTTTDTTVGGTTTRVEKWEKDELLFTAQIGKRFNDIALRGGIFESTGGVGVDYFAFDDKLQLTFEAFDFNNDDNAHLKAYAEYRLLKHIYLSAGWDDFISSEGNESPFIGFSIKFEDEDLKYLLGSVPIPK
ncbi:MAG TPA: MlaD family protein [Syntrophales bacterium]|nr:MlaD family protein [Syntrophales bacterium]